MDEVISLRRDSFEASAARDGERLALTMQGVADSRVEKALYGFMDEVQAELGARPVRRIDVDLRRVEFMAAGCFRTLVVWISRLERGVDATLERVELAGNPAFPWQRTTLEALRCLATDLVTVAMEPGA